MKKNSLSAAKTLNWNLRKIRKIFLPNPSISVVHKQKKEHHALEKLKAAGDAGNMPDSPRCYQKINSSSDNKKFLFSVKLGVSIKINFLCELQILVIGLQSLIFKTK